jgi:hypothetical protein
MCEYIITEDLLRDKYIYDENTDENNGLWYEWIFATNFLKKVLLVTWRNDA